MNSYIQGWHENGVRARLEAFVERGLPASFEPLESRDQKVIVHADFSKYLSLSPPRSNRSSSYMLSRSAQQPLVRRLLGSHHGAN